ncbi:MAG: ATP-binding cassette domain-containing protein, partial [Candidatus Bathyarchaeia archaeon]
LSGGERKRVALASVLAWAPDILVLDEPTIGQDSYQKEKLRQFILQLNQQGKTVIMVTHDIEFVAECEPKVILMANGRIVAEGDAKDVLTDPEAISAASLIFPEIAQVFLRLNDLGFPRKVISVYEAKRLILERLRPVMRL